MANILYDEVNSEVWCEDCGKIAEHECTCEPCDKCFTYSEFEADNVKEDSHYCEECFDEMVYNDLYCELCEKVDPTVIETVDGCLCEQCIYEEDIESNSLSEESLHILNSLGSSE